MNVFARVVDVLCFVLPVSFSCNLQAQHMEYSKTVGGKASGKVIVDCSETAEGYVIIMDMPGRSNVFDTDKRHSTVQWNHSNTGENSKFTITEHQGGYRIAGILKGNSIDKSVKSHGLRWIQDIPCEAAALLKESADGTVIYECFRPDDASLHSMQAKSKGQCDINGRKTIHVRISPTGSLAKVWGYDCYYDQENLHLIRYEAVEGLPGTPKTIWE